MEQGLVRGARRAVVYGLGSAHNPPPAPTPPPLPPKRYRWVPVRRVRPPKQLQQRISKMTSNIVTMICIGRVGK